ncbi:maleylpyruvate isomerase N-terminal domain-containing protein [Mycobacterium florentinum]|uniref:maleylpyruvate isomerase N-terminal domain-containing protein n=1 Tax=Mycobacterium florentinum TaxID=292462 RepID=UPI003558F56E
MQQRRPDSGTWCEAWTVRDIVIHQAGNAEELARVLGRASGRRTRRHPRVRGARGPTARSRRRRPVGRAAGPDAR